MIILNIFKKLIFISLLLILPLNGRILDVQISLDASERDADSPIGSAVGISLCQKSVPIITTAHIFYNILKAKQSGNANFAPIQIDQNWDIYKLKYSEDFYLFIPKTYKQNIINQYDTPAFRDTVAKLGVRDNIEEILIGFKINPASDVFQQVTLAEYDTPAKIEAIKHGYYSIDSKKIYKMLTQGRKEINGLWNITLDGHGYYSKSIEPNLTIDSFLKTIDAPSASLVSISLSDFRDLIQFFIKKINVNFLYYMTCYAGDINLILPYITSLLNPLGRVIGGLEKPNFTIVSGALTSEPVYVNEKITLDTCNRQADKLNIPTGYINYGRFFKLLRQYSKQEGTTPTLFKDNELKEILNAITPRVKFESDPYGISGLPSVMFPKTDTFRVVALDEKTSVISNVLAKKHELENKPIIIKDKEVILIYPQNISVPIQIDISQSKPVPSMVSMIPGLSLTKFENINIEGQFSDFVKIGLGSTKPVFNKYFYIKKLKVKNYEIWRLEKYPEGPIELSDVFISVSEFQNFVKIEIIYTGPDLSINTYSFWKNSQSQKKLGHKTEQIKDNDLLNTLFNYFYDIDNKEEIRTNFNFESFKKLLPPQDLKILEENKATTLDDLIKVFPNLLTNPNQSNNSGQIALNVAAKDNNPAAIEKIVKLGGNINAQDAQGDTPLITSAKNHSKAAFKALLDQPNIDIFKKNNAGQNAVQIIKSNDNLEQQKILINKYLPSWILNSYSNILTDQNQLNKVFASTLSSNNLDTAQLLIDLGANINAKDQDQFSMTALQKSALRGDKKLVEFLLKKGADPTLKDQYGYDALYWAKYRGFNDIVKIIEEKIPKPAPAPTHSVPTPGAPVPSPKPVPPVSKPVDHIPTPVMPEVPKPEQAPKPIVPAPTPAHTPVAPVPTPITPAPTPVVPPVPTPVAPISTPIIPTPKPISPVTTPSVPTPPTPVTPAPTPITPVVDQRKFNQTTNKLNQFINLSEKINNVKNENKKRQLKRKLNNLRKNITNQFDLNIKNQKGQTPFMVQTDLIPFLAELPKNKARQIVNAKDNDNKTILTHLIESKNNLNVQAYRTLINAGVKPTQKDIATFRQKTKARGPRFKQVMKVLRAN